MKHSSLGLICSLFLLLLPVAGMSLSAERGRKLHELHCKSCHEPDIYGTDRREIRDKDDLARQVGIWQRETGVDWDAEDILDVTEYLNGRYYRFDCVDDDC